MFWGWFFVVVFSFVLERVVMSVRGLKGENSKEKKANGRGGKWLEQGTFYFFIPEAISGLFLACAPSSFAPDGRRDGLDSVFIRPVQSYEDPLFCFAAEGVVIRIH